MLGLSLGLAPRRRGSATEDDPTVVELSAVTKRYGHGPTAFRALDRVSLRIARGEILALSGPSGAGKTTLLAIVSGRLRPTAGSVTVLGHRLDRTSPGVVRHLCATEVCTVPDARQHRARANLLDSVALSVAGGIAVADSHRRIAFHALRTLGLETRAGASLRSLSRGEQVRAAVARALARRPRLILADEPGASLDPESTDLLVRTLVRFRRESGVTIVLATCSVRTAAHADRIVWLTAGAVTGQLPLTDL
jgi:ABC-type lipoprotein export system ATPase subunit